ncbi:L-selectin-like [Haliotis asinina]|uniref:L-selectin-like n=1 Tax=Haliotis asinina TaxID=109174 RepID=UPI00353259DF
MGKRCIKVVTDPLNRNSARDHCKDYSADLITLENQAKIGEIRDFMVANGHGSGNERYWTGASQINGGWLWMNNGMTFSSTSDIWCNGEPSDITEECAAIASPTFPCIFDVVCSGTYKFVCEIQF